MIGILARLKRLERLLLPSRYEQAPDPYREYVTKLVETVYATDDDEQCDRQLERLGEAPEPSTSAGEELKWRLDTIYFVGGDDEISGLSDSLDG